VGGLYSSGCSSAVRGSRFLTAAFLYLQAAGLGDWLPRSPRSESAAHRSDRLLVAFYASAINKVAARLGGVVTGKRVAARQRLLGEFGLGSVSMRFFRL